MLILCQFPNTVSFHRDHESPQWQQVALKVPLFSTEELPNKDPSALAIYSIGEEISSSVPLAIAWSPPGLSKHRRCALGTLTTNLVFSIWAAEGKPQEESSWSRKLLINHVLRGYFSNKSIGKSSHQTSTTRELLRLRTRIRAFAWASAMPGSESTNIVGTTLSYSPFLIAVSNDDNQMAFVEIESPTSSLGRDQAWNAKILTHFSLIIPPESILSEPTTFEDMMKQQRHISHIAWSPWILRDNCYYSVVVYATNNDARARMVTYADKRISLGNEITYQDFDLRFNGPMKWCPRVENADHLTLALFGSSGIVFLTISTRDASIIERISHNLDGRWGLTSGVVWDINLPSAPRLHFSSLLSTLHNPTAALEVSSAELRALPSPNWRDRIENNLVLFSVKNDLKGNSRAKVWGLSASPLRDFIVACNSVHPSDMIEYGPPADRRGTVAISTMRPFSQMREAFPRRGVSAEGVLFTLQKLVENSVEDTDRMPEFAQEMVGKLMQAYTSPFQSEGNDDITAIRPNAGDLNTLVEGFKKSVFLNPAALKDRYTLLVAHACAITTSNDISKTLIAYRLATALQDLPIKLSSTPFSDEILSHHQCLIVLINKVIGPDTVDTTPSSVENAVSDAEDVAEVDNSVMNETERLVKGFEASMTDICDFCSAPIPFTDLMSANCTQGHQFPRCGLSFLAIQAPGITKYCGICSTPFLSEEFVAAQEEVGAHQQSENLTAGTVSNVDQIGSETRDAMSEDRNTSENPENRHAVDSGSNDGIRNTQMSEQIQGQSSLVNVDGIKRSNLTQESKRELPVTLAKVLFLACDACIYCGGKFVG